LENPAYMQWVAHVDHYPQTNLHAQSVLTLVNSQKRYSDWQLRLLLLVPAGGWGAGHLSLVAGQDPVLLPPPKWPILCRVGR